MTETLATLPLMERVLFLRRVPLFTDLPPQDLVPIASIASEQASRTRTRSPSKESPATRCTSSSPATSW